jgi:hypothetical protein
MGLVADPGTIPYVVSGAVAYGLVGSIFSTYLPLLMADGPARPGRGSS